MSIKDVALVIGTRYTISCPERLEKILYIEQTVVYSTAAIFRIEFFGAWGSGASGYFPT